MEVIFLLLKFYKYLCNIIIIIIVIVIYLVVFFK